MDVSKAELNLKSSLSLSVVGQTNLYWCFERVGLKSQNGGMVLFIYILPGDSVGNTIVQGKSIPKLTFSVFGDCNQGKGQEKKEGEKRGERGSLVKGGECCCLGRNPKNERQTSKGRGRRQVPCRETHTTF